MKAVLVMVGLRHAQFSHPGAMDLGMGPPAGKRQHQGSGVGIAHNGLAGGCHAIQVKMRQQAGEPVAAAGHGHGGAAVIVERRLQIGLALGVAPGQIVLLRQHMPAHNGLETPAAQALQPALQLSRDHRTGGRHDLQARPRRQHRDAHEPSPTGAGDGRGPCSSQARCSSRSSHRMSTPVMARA